MIPWSEDTHPYGFYPIWWGIWWRKMGNMMGNFWNIWSSRLRSGRFSLWRSERQEFRQLFIVKDRASMSLSPHVWVDRSNLHHNWICIEVASIVMFYICIAVLLWVFWLARPTRLFFYDLAGWSCILWLTSHASTFSTYRLDSNHTRLYHHCLVLVHIPPV